MTFFTICSNNYLAQARILGSSVKKFYPKSKFFVALVDTKSILIDYITLGFDVIPIGDIESKIDDLSQKYDTVELNTCIKPAVFEYLFNQTAEEKVIYMDPDTKIFGSMSAFEDLMGHTNIILTPHILTPIPLDGKTPGETAFLNFGVYNLGFLALTKSEETDRFIVWWKERTYQQGYARVADGLFVDQLYVNLVPLLFKNVHIFRNMGFNMAPWNLHERWLSKIDGHWCVNATDGLVFYHFSSFKVDAHELPLSYYNRFTLAERKDISELYYEYNEEMKVNMWSAYVNIEPHYTKVYRAKKIFDEQERIKKLSLIKRWVYSAVLSIPGSFRKRLAIFFSH